MDDREPPRWMSENELRLLRFFAYENDVLEMGRFCGLSTYHLAKTAITVDSYDLMPVEFARRELERLRADMSKIRLFQAPFSEISKSDFTYDLILVDGHHDAASVERDLKIAIEHNANIGFIAVHDYGEKSVWPEVKPTADRVLGAAHYKLLCQIDTLAIFQSQMWYA